MSQSWSNPGCILITGASSGIGEALAHTYAGDGRTLLLTGRNAGRLDAVARRCRKKGAVVKTSLTDVTDRDGMKNLIKHWFSDRAIDLAVANAGISGRGNSMASGRHDAEATRDIFAINLTGVINTVEPLVPLMIEQGGGQIAVISSLAGFRGMPSAPAYAASKAAVRSWGEGLRGQLADSNIAVNVICPGFVESRITRENDFPMPFLMEAAPVAAIIRRGLARNRGRIAFPMPMVCAVWLFSTLPFFLTDWLANRLPRKD